jgi:uncharacterized repeat protein (TIGR03803 family)
MRTARYVGFLVAALAAVLVASPVAHAAFTTPHDFAGEPDGANPFAGLLQPDPARGFYGTTYAGGGGSPDSGTIFYMQTDGTVTILSTFGGSPANPFAPLIRDSHGVYYGTTTLVGGHGSVFFMTDNGSDPPTVTGGGTLCSFTGTGGDGDTPRAALLQAADDTFYGTTQYGGANNLGTIFRMDVVRDVDGVPTGATCATIYDFAGVSASPPSPPHDGALPVAALILASDGNIYGTTYVGGENNLGTIFRLVVGAGPTYSVELLHSFAGAADGEKPYAALLQSAPGGFYGTASAGGANNSGTVFYMQNSAPWTVTTLASFPSDAGTPYAPLIRDTDKVFYGTTALGGDNKGGNIFVMTVDTSDPPTLTLGATIHSFPMPVNPGEYGPAAPILKGADGSFYGTTYQGGLNDLGTIFKFTHTAQTISFAAIPNQLFPGGPLTLSATASSGLPVTFSAGPSGVCTLTPPATVNFVAVGVCKVTASQIGDGDYKPAPDVSRSFGIGGAGVDLIVTVVSNPPTYAAPGSNFSVTDTTQNQGMLPAYGPITGYYLAPDNTHFTIQPGDILLQNGLRPLSTLKAGDSSTGTVAKVYVPTNTPLNTYYLKACADYNKRVAESDETNNCLHSGTQVVVTKPDLVVSQVDDPPATAARGSRFTFQNKVTNQGNVPAGAFVVSYYLSKTTGGNSLLGVRSLSSLGALTDSLAIASVLVPGTAKGVYRLQVCADTTNSVKETDETNNCMLSVNTVTVP